MTTEMPKDQMKPQVSPAQADIVEQATESMLGPNPFVGLRLETLLESYRELGEQAARHPALALEQTAVLFRELIAVLSGSSTLAPAADDKRFGSDVWRENSFYRIYLQSYLTWSASLENFVDRSSLDADNKARARFAVSALTDAFAPTNSLLGNPDAIGIGGSLTASPLPHHRAYGSVHGGS